MNAERISTGRKLVAIATAKHWRFVFNAGAAIAVAWVVSWVLGGKLVRVDRIGIHGVETGDPPVRYVPGRVEGGGPVDVRDQLHRGPHDRTLKWPERRRETPVSGEGHPGVMDEGEMNP